MGYDQTIGKQFFGIVEELLRIGESYSYDNDTMDVLPIAVYPTEVDEQN